MTHDSRDATCGSKPQTECTECKHVWVVDFKAGPLQPGQPCNCGAFKWPGPEVEREHVRALEEARKGGGDAPV